jgi:hypothetical protein
MQWDPASGAWLAPWMKYQVFTPILLLLGMNLFWYFLILRIAKRCVSLCSLRPWNPGGVGGGTLTRSHPQRAVPEDEEGRARGHALGRRGRRGGRGGREEELSAQEPRRTRIPFRIGEPHRYVCTREKYEGL